MVENPVDCLHSERSRPLPLCILSAFFWCSMSPQDGHRWLPLCPACDCTMWQRGQVQEPCTICARLPQRCLWDVRKWLESRLSAVREGYFPICKSCGADCSCQGSRDTPLSR